MKKVLLVTTQFPPFQGGGELYYYKLCNEFPRDRIAVLADDAHNEAYKQFMPKYEYPVYYRSFYFNYFWPKWLKLFYHLYRIVHIEHPDVIWAAQPLPIGTVVMWFCKIYGIEYFETTHGADVLNPIRRKGIIGAWKSWLVKSVLRGAAFVTANSEYTRLILTRLGVSRERTVLVYPTANILPPASELAFSATIDRIEQLKQQGYQILVTTARLVRRKGQDKVIEALPRVWKEFPKLLYVMISDGPYRNNLQLLADKALGEFSANQTSLPGDGSNPEIILTGKVSDEELKRVYELCDIFIMIPREIAGLVEGFGMVYIEAGSFGKPVIGAKTGGAPEAIIDLFDQNYDKATGLLVGNAESAHEIAQKILMLLKDPGLAKKLGTNGTRQVERFTWKNGAQAIMDKLS